MQETIGNYPHKCLLLVVQWHPCTQEDVLGGGDKDTHELSLETLCMVQETRTGRVNYVHNNNNMLAVF